MKRNVLINFRITEEERGLIKEKMALAKISNREAYLRKMALDGYIIRLDLSDVREMVRLLSNVSNNINQIAKHVNETHGIYKSDMREILAHQERLWEQADTILRMLASIQK